MILDFSKTGKDYKEKFMETMKVTDLSFWNLPVGHNRPYLVTCNGAPCAGYDNRQDAEVYIDMQRRSRSKGKKSAAAEMTWDIKFQGN